MPAKAELSHKRGSRQSAPEYSISFEKPPIVNRKILTTPKLGPQKTASVIAFIIALKLDVKIVWFGRHATVCVNGAVQIFVSTLPS